MPSRQPVQVMKTPERAPLRERTRAPLSLFESKPRFRGILKLLLSSNAIDGVEEKKNLRYRTSVAGLNRKTIDLLFHCNSNQNWLPRFKEFKFTYLQWKQSGYTCKPVYYGKMEEFLQKHGKHFIKSNLARKMGGGYIVCVDNNEKPIKNIWKYDGYCTIFFNTRLLVRHIHRFVNKLLQKSEYQYVGKRYNLTNWKKDIWGQYRELSN